MRKSIVPMSFVFLLAAAPLFPGAPVTNLAIGPGFGGSPNSSDQNGGTVRTDIDLVQPATATGTVTSAHVFWSSTGCTNSMKIKFFRRSGNSLTMIAERGPFTPTTFDFTVAMSPGVPVQQGDLIGVTRLANCGNPGTFVGFPTAGYLQYLSDVTGSVNLADGSFSGAPLALGGTGTAVEMVRATIPVVASTAGAEGANFKTSMQLLYGAPLSTGSISGRLVFHQAGTSGSASDPVLNYTIDSGNVISYPDIVATFGRSGLGSVDLITGLDATLPVIVTRVFNDGGAAQGTAGLTEDPIEPSDKRVIFTGFTAFLVTPIDPVQTRFNIGVRSGVSGATLTAILRDSSGNALHTVTKTYEPNWLEQVSSTVFFEGTAVGADQSIVITVSSGSAIVYGATTDNTSNDPNVQFATALFGID